MLFVVTGLLRQPYVLDVELVTRIDSVISGRSRGGARGSRPPLPHILGKERRNTRRKKSWQSKKNKTAPAPTPQLTQGLDPPLL